MSKKKKQKKRKLKRIHAKASAWAYREYLKGPHVKLSDDLLRQIEQSRRQRIVRVVYEPERIVLKMG
jgi:hypothetical protein